MYRSKNKLLSHIGLSSIEYTHIVDNLNKYYYSWKTPKLSKRNKPKYINGKIKVRTLNPSRFKLKDIQFKIFKLLKNDITFPIYYMGGIKGKDNLKNAKYHQGNQYFFSTDLEDFFPSITAKNIYWSLTDIGYSADVSRIITRLCTIDNQLPQGIHPATLLANIVTLNMTNELSDICKKNSITFSIFVDDLNFSSKIDFKNKTIELIKTICKYDFRINHRKTFYKHGKTLMTGCNVRQNKITPASYVYYNYNNEPDVSKKKSLDIYIKRFSK